MPKTTFTASDIEHLLRQRMGEVSDVEHLTEGLASQAFGFRSGLEELVLRINPRREAFEKDAFVYGRFGRPGLPIPEIIDVGVLGGDAAYCISRRSPGVRLCDLPPSGLDLTVESVVGLLDEVAASDLTGTSGFGSFDGTGIGRIATWHDFIIAAVDSDYVTSEMPGGHAVGEIVERAQRSVADLAHLCPEERRLIHGDFGSYNILAENGRVTALLDWDLAMFGDPLYDIAKLLFWHEDCLTPLIDRVEAAAQMLPLAAERLMCYQLRIGLQELRHMAGGYVPEDLLPWIVSRFSHLLTITA